MVVPGNRVVAAARPRHYRIGSSIRTSKANVRPSCIHLISVRDIWRPRIGFVSDKWNAGTACQAGSFQSAVTAGNRAYRPISSGGSVFPSATCLRRPACRALGHLESHELGAGRPLPSISGANARRDRIRSARHRPTPAFQSRSSVPSGSEATTVQPSAVTSADREIPRSLSIPPLRPIATPRIYLDGEVPLEAARALYLIRHRTRSSTSGDAMVFLPHGIPADGSRQHLAARLGQPGSQPQICAALLQPGFSTEFHRHAALRGELLSRRQDREQKTNPDALFIPTIRTSLSTQTAESADRART